MLKELKKDAVLFRILLILLIIAVGSYVFGITWGILGNFSDIFIMLIVAWLLSFVLEPLVEQVVSLTNLSKVIVAFIVYLLFLSLFAAIVFLLIPTVMTQVQILSTVIPIYLDTYPGFINKIGDSITSYANNSIVFLPSVAQFFFSAFISLIISFYFVVDKEKINSEIFYLIPHKWHDEVKFLQKVIRDVFASFLQVQLLFGISSGIITWLILWLLGVEFATLAAFLAGIFAMIPLIGPVLALIPPVFVALIADPARGLIVFIVLLIAQQVIFNIVGPRLLGKAFRVHPAIVLISFFIGGKIAGPVGAVFAIPVLGIITILVRELSHHFFTPTDLRK